MNEREMAQRAAARPRAVELAILWYGGCTLTEIGAAIGLSRERVRQLIRTVVPTKRAGELVNIADTVARYGVRGSLLSTKEHKVLRALGYPPRTKVVSRTERRKRRQRLLNTVIRLGAQLGRCPLYPEVSRALMGSDNGAPVLIGYVTSSKARRGCRLLSAIWRKAGYTPRRGTQRGVPRVRRVA